ncbi:MAG: PSD1 and planctomycete cytochrome C domain-containing protein [Pirellulaceae bacterium]|nr:PSD1 and planctomycete cytochrome C domain-containing protein [Pirellulaceae bacterium]
MDQKSTTKLNPIWKSAIALQLVSLLLIAFCFTTNAVSQAVATDDAELLFVRRVQPLLNEKCMACHGNDESNIEGGLDLRSLATMQLGGDHEQPIVVMGKPDQSPLLLAIMRGDQDWQPMPPKEADQLTAEQIGWIRDWIVGGAPWPDRERIQVIAAEHAERWAAEDGFTVKTIGGLSPEWANRRYKPEGLWGYQPVRKPALQPSEQHPIDTLIGLRMPEGIEVAPAAGARTFIRRATFDLTGLPPQPEAIAAFEKAYALNEEAAVRELIDRLLKSPHYGERMGQHWLDVTRYADSSGFANDYERGNAWRYRDYVIRAFNGDKPYDQFIREQIAGDEIAPDDPEAIIATGFLRMGPWELTGMEVAKIARQRFLDDVTNSIGETFLAHSLQCARCHDHKFDPIPTHDYYAVQAVFATTQLCERSAAFLPSENTHGFEERRYLERMAAEYQATLSELDRLLLANAQKWFKEKGLDATKWNAAIEAVKQVDVNAKHKRKDYADVFSAVRNSLLTKGVPESDFPPKLVGFTTDQFGLERVARKGIERLKWQLDRYEPYALAVYSGRTVAMKSVTAPIRVPKNRLTDGELEESCIHIGGDPFAEGAQVEPGVLSALDFDHTAEIPNSIEGRRAAFAAWVANKDNPLTARAIVNRIWLWHFGDAIAGNPNNFGSTGKRPTHPELLDWLAANMVEQQWSFKALHRLIMTSKAYRRSSRHPNVGLLRTLDPAGTSYAVFKPRRLSAEELRDAMLAASGELNLAIGGIPCRPEINLEAALQPRQVMGTFASAWVPNPKPEQRNRRSIYALKLRGLSDPAMEVFNAPAPDFSCERRESSVVTPQVFAMFNGQATHTRALALAHRVLKETIDDTAAITKCFELVFGRAPKPDELSACLEHWHQCESTQPMPAVASVPPLEVRREAVEENTGEKFSFVETLYAYADYIPDLQPADVSARTRALADVCLALFNTNEFVYVY